MHDKGARPPPLEIVSLGAGIQSTAMALLAAHGRLTPMPDCAIFADTGAERAATYAHLRWLASGNVLPFPVHVVKGGAGLLEDLRTSAAGERNVHRRARGLVAAPFHVENADGSRGMLRRECTSEYKLKPIRTRMRELAGLAPGARAGRVAVREWLGISHDEVHRARPSREEWLETRFPLLDDLDPPWTRGHCIEWLLEMEYDVPTKSACVFCPYQDDGQWREVMAEPADGSIALEVDGLVRGLPSLDNALRPDGRLYVHRSAEPLATVDLTDPHANQIRLWDAECDGFCGL